MVVLLAGFKSLAILNLSTLAWPTLLIYDNNNNNIITCMVFTPYLQANVIYIFGWVVSAWAGVSYN